MLWIIVENTVYEASRWNYWKCSFGITDLFLVNDSETLKQLISSTQHQFEETRQAVLTRENLESYLNNWLVPIKFDLIDSNEESWKLLYKCKKLKLKKSCRVWRCVTVFVGHLNLRRTSQWKVSSFARLVTRFRWRWRYQPCLWLCAVQTHHDQPVICSYSAI